MKKNLALSSVITLILGSIGLWQLSNARTFQLFGQIIPRVSTEDRVVALTFDDGPSAKYTDEVLSVLNEHGVKATFFVTGSEVENNLDQAKKIVAAGHKLGNHSYSHPRLIFKAPSTVREEIERTDAAIRTAGFESDIHFRPPYGKKLFILPWYLAKRDRSTIMWDVEPESDPEIDSDSKKIAAHVLEKVQPGSIVLLHVMYKSRTESREALPVIIRGLHEQGYEFVSVSELLDRRGAR